MESAYFSETAEGKKSLRDGDDGKLALVLDVEDVQVELNPQPSRRVAVVAALNPETAVISATSIYLTALVITNGVYICSMLIDGCSNIWWVGALRTRTGQIFELGLDLNI